MDAVPDTPNSEYGDLQLDFDPDNDTLFFANIVARRVVSGVPQGSPQWLVENLGVPSAVDIGVATATAAQTIDLSMIGVTRGSSVVGQQIEYTVVFSTAPLSLQPVFNPDFVTTIRAREYSFGGVVTGGPANPCLDPPQPIAKAPFVDDGRPAKRVLRRNVPNGEQGTNQCGPAALTNSLHWLAAQYPKQVDLFGQSWNDTLLKFKAYTSWNINGISARNAVVGKLLFSLDPSKEFDPELVVKYQSSSVLADLGASVTAGGKTANRQNDGSPPTFDWLLGELQAGEDVEIALHWLSNDATKVCGGHMVVVVGAMRVGNKMYLWTNDDGKQGPKIGDPPIPPTNGGLRTLRFHQVDIANGGFMRLSNFGMNNRVVATFSESLSRLIIPTVSAWGMGVITLLLLTGITIKFGRRRVTA
jgi:hypothetical protein